MPRINFRKFLHCKSRLTLSSQVSHVTCYQELSFGSTRFLAELQSARDAENALKAKAEDLQQLVDQANAQLPEIPKLKQQITTAESSTFVV
jgi:hypothetical protein